MNTDLTRKLDKFIDDKNGTSKKYFIKELDNFMKEYNSKITEINNKLGKGIGEIINDINYHLNNAQFKKVIILCDKILKIYPDCVEVLLLKTGAHFSLEEYDLVSKCIAQCDDLQVEDPELYFMKSQIFIKEIFSEDVSVSKTNFDKALFWIDKALELDDKYFDILMAKAQLLFWKGDQSFREYIVKARKEDRERTNRFMTCYWIEELPLFHPLMELNNALTKIDLLIKETNFEEALIKIDILLDNKLLNRQLKEVVLSMKIECLLSLKKYDDAKNIIDTLIKFSKHYPVAYVDLAIYYKYIKDFNNALKSINKAIMLGEKHKQLHWQSYQLKSEILKELGDTSYTEYAKKAEVTKKKNLRYFKTVCKEKGLDYNQYRP